MGLIDALLKNPEIVGDLAKFALDNPEIANAALSLFSNEQGSIGGSTGLGDILRRLEGNGLGEQVASWLGDGHNEPISAGHVEAAIGSKTLSQFASEAGLTASQAGETLARLLPMIVDRLSPNGKLPDGRSIADAIGGFAHR